MKTYLKQLDFLRCYAVFMVVFGHIPLMSLSEFNLFKVLDRFVPGVPLFFCISGFLITSILISNRRENTKQLLKSFYFRRFIRIFPIYYLTIFVLFIIAPADYRSWVGNDLLYISNFVLGESGGFGINPITPHFWSLAVEEQFYLFWPFLLLVFNEKYSKLLAIIICLTGLMFFVVSNNSFFISKTFGCLSYLGAGAVLANYFYKVKSNSNLKLISNFMIITLLIFITLQSLNLFVLDTLSLIIFQTILMPFIVFRFSIGFQGRFFEILFENKVVSYLGKISYGIYVYHLLMLFPALIFREYLGFSFLNDELSMQIFKIVLAVVVSILSWELLEKRINKLKSRFKYS